MPTKKPSAKQLAARAKFVKMVRAKAAKNKAAKKKTVNKIVKKKTVKKAAKKKTIKQTGTSNKVYDKRFEAKKPGKRKTSNPHKYRGKTIKKSTTYTENRENRSDKGRLLGISKICGLPKYKDPIAAREIELYATNDNDLYRQQRRPILINLSKKHKKGLYKIELAAKLWRYFIDSALKKYNKEFGSRGDKWYEILNVSDRQLLAEEFAKETKDEFDLGNYTEK